MMAVVFSVTSEATEAGSMVRSAPMSAKTGTAPTDKTALAVATYEKDGTITSSPFPTSKASRDA